MESENIIVHLHKKLKLDQWFPSRRWMIFTNKRFKFLQWTQFMIIWYLQMNRIVSSRIMKPNRSNAEGWLSLLVLVLLTCSSKILKLTRLHLSQTSRQNTVERTTNKDSYRWFYTGYDTLQIKQMSKRSNIWLRICLFPKLKTRGSI